MSKGVGTAKRRIAKTLLIVGEGDSECVLLSHLKSIYVVRGSGWVVSIKNARGKGAAHVVDFTIRQAQNGRALRLSRPRPVLRRGFWLLMRNQLRVNPVQD